MYMTRSKVRASRKIARLQRRWRLYRSRIDPITRSVVQFPIFVHFYDGGSTVFTAKILAEYILASGDYRNPMTREEFHACEIRRLARIARRPELVTRRREFEEMRRRATERESLRTWFMSELETDIYMLRNFARRPTSTMPYSTSYVVRHMLASTFPSLIVNIVRVLRIDIDYSSDLFRDIRNIVSTMREAMVQEEALTPQFTTSLVVFDQFLRDLELHVEDGSLLSGSNANVIIGGMQINLNLTDI